MNRCDIATTAEGKLTGNSILYSVVNGMPSTTMFTDTISCQVLPRKNNSFTPVPLVDPTLAVTPCNSCGTSCSVSYTLSTGSMPKSYLVQNNSIQLAYYPTKVACSADFATSASSTSSEGWSNLMVFSLPMPTSTVSMLFGNPAAPEWAYTKYVALPSCSVGAKGEVLVQAQLYPSSSYSHAAGSSSTTQTLSFYGDTGGKLSKTLYITSSLLCSDQGAGGSSTSCVAAQQPRISSSLSSFGGFLETGDETVDGWPFSSLSSSSSSSSSPGVGTALVDYLDEETQAPVTLKSCVLTGPGSLAAKCTLSAKVKIPSGTLINAANTYGAANLVAGSTGCTATATLSYHDRFVKATCKNPLPPMVPTTQGQYVYRSFHNANKQHCRGATYMWEIEPIVLNGCQTGVPALGSSLRYTCKQGGGDKKNTFTLSKATYAGSALCEGAASNEVMRHDTDCSSLDGSRTGCGMLPQEMLSSAHVVVDSYDSAKCGSDLTALRRITVYDVCAPSGFVSSERYRRVVSFVARNTKKLKLSVRRFAYDDESCSGEQIGKTETVTYMIGAPCQADPLYPRAFVKSFSLGPLQNGSITTLPPTAIPTASPTPEPSAFPSPAPTAPTAVPTFYISPDVTTLLTIRKIWQNRLSSINTLANSTANNWITPLSTLRPTKYNQGYAACDYGGGSQCDRITCDNQGNIVAVDLNNLGLTTAGMAATLQQLAKFPILTSLVVQANTFTGTFPSAIGLLTNLRWLSLRSNSITALPTEIGLLTRLTGLELYSAGLKGTIPTLLGSLKSMQTLDISRNSLAGSIPTQLGNLGKWLTGLYLEENQLTGQVPSQFLNLKKLSTLSLSKNKLSGTIGAANLCGIPCANGGSLTLYSSSTSSEKNNFCFQSCMFSYFLPSWNYQSVWGYTSSSGGAGGHTLQCNVANAFPVSYYPDTPFVVTKKNLLGYVTLPTKFSLSFDINAQEYDGNWRNLLHLSAVNTDNNAGSRLPAIYSCKTDTEMYSGQFCKYMGLAVRFHTFPGGTADVTIPPLTANSWYTITVTVDWTSDMNYVYIGASNSSTVLLRPNIDIQPRLPSQTLTPLPLVYFYASSDWYPEAKASIRNLALTLPLPFPLRVNNGRWPEIGQSGWHADNAGGEAQKINVALSATNSWSQNVIINKILYYKTVAGEAANSTARVGAIYSGTGTLLSNIVTFTGGTSKGWQMQALSTPVTIAPYQTFRVVVNMKSYVTSTFPSTTEGIFSNLCSYYSYSATISFPTNQQCAWNRMIDIVYTTNTFYDTVTVPTSVPDLVVSLDAASYSTGSAWIDSVSGQEYKPYGSETFLPTKNDEWGGSIVFDSSKQQYMQGPPTMWSLSTWSLELWYFHTGVGYIFNGGPSSLICDLRDGSGNSNFHIFRYSDNDIRLGYGNIVGSVSLGSFSTLFPSNAWYHIVATFDGTTPKFYVNNVNKASTANWSGLSAPPMSGKAGIRLMNRWDLNDLWGGSLAIVKIYSKALNASEVSKKFDANKERFGLI
jgi:hypothetical protein